MKALTIKQPWAHLICTGVKGVENRTWKSKYRGTILIHSSKFHDKRHRNMSSLFTSEQWAVMSSYMKEYMNCGIWLNSAIIGSVDLISVIDDSSSVWAEDNCWHWILSNPVLFKKPIENVKGKLSLWNYVEDTNEHN